MTAEEIIQYLTELDEELRQMDIKGEVSLFGGAVMCLAFNARPATKDVDAIFKPVPEIRKACRRIAERHRLEVDWLNFAVKMFVVEHKREILFDMPNLLVTVPEPDYLLAMKMLSLRPDTQDEPDVNFLIDRLGLDSMDEVLGIIENYYPGKIVKEETLAWLESRFRR